jgi:hypothetical protein
MNNMRCIKWDFKKQKFVDEVTVRQSEVGDVLLRYSGKRDFYGFEIKEGDIILYGDNGGELVQAFDEQSKEFFDNNVGVVSYDQSIAAFHFEIGSVGEGDIFKYLCLHGKMRIVGNIFTHNLDEVRAKVLTKKGCKELIDSYKKSTKNHCVERDSDGKQASKQL